MDSLRTQNHSSRYYVTGHSLYSLHHLSGHLSSYLSGCLNAHRRGKGAPQISPAARASSHRLPLLALALSMAFCLLGVGVAWADPPATPDTPQLSNLLAHSVTATLPALPDGAVSLTLQTKEAYDYEANYEDVATNLAGGSTQNISGLAANTYYAVRCVAVNGEGQSAGYETYAQTLPDAPAVPATPLFLTVTATTVRVQIPSLPTDAYQVKLQYKASGSTSWSEAGTYDSYAASYGSEYPAEIYGLSPETTYLVRWVAEGYGGSTAGNTNAVTTTPAPPQTPDAPLVSQITALSAQVELPALPTGATSLRLEKALGDGYGSYGEGLVFETVASALAGGATVALSALAPQTYYTLRAVAEGAGGDTTGFNASFGTLPPAPAAPATPTFEAVGAIGLQVPLPAFPTYAEQLKLQRRLSSTPAAGDWIDTGQFDNWYYSAGERAYVYELQPETAYEFRWLAIGQGGQTAGSAATVTTTPAPPQAPEAPSFGTVTATTAQVTLPALPTGATTLRLEKRTNDDYYNPTYVTVAEDLGAGDSVTIIDLTPASYLAFRAVAVGIGGETAGPDGYCYTPELPPGTPPAPQFANVAATQLEVTVPTAPSNTYSLRLQVKAAAAGEETYSDAAQVNVGEGNTPPSVTAYGLQPETTYAFHWIASGNGGDTAGPGSQVTTLAEGEPSATPTPTPTSNPTPTPTPTTPPLPRPVDVTLRAGNENASGNFTGEDLYSSDGANQQVTQTVVPDGTLSYTVRVQNQTATASAFEVLAPGDELGWSVRYYFIDTPTDPETPPAAQDITDDITGEGWMTPVLEPQARCTLRVDVEPTTVQQDGETKTVPIQAAVVGGTPDDVDVAQVIAVLNVVAAPPNLTATGGIEQVQLSWGAVSDVTGYNLYRSTTTGGPYTVLAEHLTGTTYTDTQVTVGTAYFYVVRAYDALYEGESSNQATATPLATPDPDTTAPAVTIGAPADQSTQYALPLLGGTANDPTVEGQARSGLHHVSVTLRKTVNETLVYWTGTAWSETTATFTWTAPSPANAAWSLTQNLPTGANLTAGAYHLQAIASDAAGNASQPASSDFTLAVPDAPLNLAATAGAGQVALTWTASDHATGYNLYRSATDGGPYSLRASTIIGTTYLDTQVVADTTYYYVVRAVCAVGESAISNQASATPTPNEPDTVEAQPDLLIRAYEDSNYVGDNSYTLAERSQVAAAGMTSPFLVRLENTVNGVAKFRLKVENLPTGWTAQLVDVTDDSLHSDASLMGEGWILPVLEANDFRNFRLEVTPAAGEVAVSGAVTLSAVSMVGNPLSDSVRATLPLQRLGGVEISFDHGTNWLNASSLSGTNPPEVVQRGVVGFRALKDRPSIGWPVAPAALPSWAVEGATPSLFGSEVWIQFNQVAGSTVSIEGACSNSQTVQVKVRPNTKVRLSSGRGTLLSGATPASMAATPVMARLTDEAGNLVSGARVRFEVTGEANSGAQINESGTADDEATSDGNGEATVTVTSGSATGTLKVKAIVVGAQGQSLNQSLDLNLRIIQPRKELEYGEWQEVNNQWQRTVKVTVTHFFSKVQGRSVTLSSQIWADGTDHTTPAGLENALSFDNATGTSGADGTFTTIQHFAPPQNDPWWLPWDVEIPVSVTLS